MQKKAEYTLAELADYLDATLLGDATCKVSGLASLPDATVTDISFLSDSKYVAELAGCQAAAVVVSAEYADKVQGNILVSDNPYLGFAKISCLFDDRPPLPVGIHSMAQISEGAHVAASAAIGPHAVIESGAVISEGVEVGAGCFIGADVQIGDDSLLAANVTVYHGVSIGARAIIHSGAVIGADGFGFANHQGQWQKIAQLGSVSIADDVEIGANTTIDRGALQDTIIEEGVKIDNQVMVAHNVRIGKHTAIAACVGVSGSTEIGSHCMIAGGVGFAGHLKITDRVFVTAMSFVTKSITQSGSYSSGSAMMPTPQWKKNSVRVKKLDALVKQVRKLEKEITKLQNQDHLA
ncbi:MAG: UDP-3-O-(3-hydroxymyristoyl)glucosamine N-acyltransferase [Pseudomonadales bacterium]